MIEVLSRTYIYIIYIYILYILDSFVSYLIVNCGTTPSYMLNIAFFRFMFTLKFYSDHES